MRIRVSKSSAPGIIWFLVVILFFNGGLMERLLSAFAGGSSSTVEYDYDMDTEQYKTAVTIDEDGSYVVKERIDVEFYTNKHGIFRYIPIKGVSSYVQEDGAVKNVPYQGEVELLGCNVPVDVSKENGNVVFRMGDESYTVWGPQSYELSYRFTPEFQKEEADYQNVYYNVFPGSWQNQIPAGSRFSITFPKDFPSEKLQFYYGSYGERKDGENVLDLVIDGNTVRGELLTKLELGEGMTFFAAMEPGYFTGVHTLPNYNGVIIGVSIAILLVIAVMFLLFGRDEKMYPSIEFQPPQDLDSAAVGYIVDGTVEDRDIISLLIYWADKGYMRIEESESGKLTFYREKDLPADAPSYQKTVWRKLFKAQSYVELSNLEEKFASTIQAAKEQVKMVYNNTDKGGIYSRASQIARGVALIFGSIPFGIFLILSFQTSVHSGMHLLMYVLCYLGYLLGGFGFCRSVDTWYGKSSAKRKRAALVGIGLVMLSLAFFGGNYIARIRNGMVLNMNYGLLVMIICSVAMAIMTGFMKKRTHQCVQWMGRLVGLREVIETAELERMEEMAKTNPQWFYHIIPYAYVFGLSDVFAEKLKGLSLPAPQWYSSSRMGSYDFLDYYWFHRCFMGNMRSTTKVMTTPPQPQVPSGGSGSGFGGGGFGGGGGGFSGGGFGGGGGGSW